MRKGETKRQEMLQAAERLFCARGYDATSVQDILDALHVSKGGFYHHFASKEEVLKTLCTQRAERAAAFTTAELENAQGDMARINVVLHGFMPLRQQEAPFAAMLLPLIERSEGRAMGMIYQDALNDFFLPLLEKEMASAAANGAIFPPVRGMESVILQLVNRCWMDAAASFSRIVREGGRYDLTSLLLSLERYRRAIEVLLDAPYGSVELIRIEEWDSISTQLMRALQNS